VRIPTARNSLSIGFREAQVDPHPASFVDRALRVGLVIGFLVWVLAIWKMVELLGLL